MGAKADSYDMKIWILMTVVAHSHSGTTTTRSVNAVTPGMTDDNVMTHYLVQFVRTRP